MTNALKKYPVMGNSGSHAVALAINGLQNYSDFIPYRIAPEYEIERAVEGEPTSLFGYALITLKKFFLPSKKYLGACKQDGEILLSAEADESVKVHEDAHWLLQKGIIRKPDYIPEEKFADMIADEYVSKRPIGGIKGFA